MQKTSKKLVSELFVDVDEESCVNINEVHPYWNKLVLIINTISSSLYERFKRDIRIVPGYINTSKNFFISGTEALDRAFTRTKKLWFAVDDTSDEVKNYLISMFNLEFNDEININIYDLNYLFCVDIDTFEDLYMLCKMMKRDQL